jgi:two-component system response regulator AtoC
LQERTIERLGSNLTIPLDVRIITASNRNPKLAIAEKKLREDLYYRLNIFTIELPALRERQDDILPLANYFIKKHAADFGYHFSGIKSEAEAYLTTYAWPGNVRELENMMERAIVLSGGKTIACEHLPIESAEHNQDTPLSQQNIVESEEIDQAGLNVHVEKLEKQLIKQALEQTKDNKAAAAQILKISERSLWYKIKKYF